MQARAKKWIGSFLMLGLSLLVIEGLLQLAAAVSPRVRAVLTGGLSATVPDAHLEWRPRPGLGDHDRRGFRNPAVPAEAWAVALGDSQTYGVGVTSAAAWPRQVAAQTGKPIYSMAFGGYGPVHSLLLWPEAAQRKPRWVIEAFYAGNDLYDAFHLVHDRGERPELKSADPKVVAGIRAAESRETLLQRIERLSPAPASPPDPRPFWRRALSEHCKLFGLVRAAKNIVQSSRAPAPRSEAEEWDEAVRRATALGPACQAFQAGPFKTVFRPEYRLTALNLEDPRIAEGWKISLQAIGQLSVLSSNAGSQFFVLLVPTKELVLAPYWTNAPPTFGQLIRNETTMWDQTKTELGRQGIPFVDGLPLLRQELAQQRQPYPVTDDGHPNATGHRALADGVVAFLREKEAAGVPRN
jgi:hypothetical protein